MSAAAAGLHQQQPPCGQPGKAVTARHRPGIWLAALLLGLASLAWQPSLCRAQQADADEKDAQVLTRGPVHEAFAGIVTFNPEPGVVVPKAPPEAIEEIPPDERPEGDNVTWIPGYWAWDDERGDFLWISGIWRALPPGRQWIAGYWGQTADGYQWTSGYWADAAAKETTYLPEPPATVESGPNIEAPSSDYGWTPGCWVWRQQRYAWRPGYWAQGRANWNWMPAHYVWTPRGYVFVDGYWDYTVARRGVAFAPVAFGAGVYGRPGYTYSPSIVIDLALVTEQLFLRPHYQHYYFGDYYAPSYHQGGFYAASAYQSSRIGYDPLFAQQRWANRNDRLWEQRVTETYQDRRDHESARPPRTWTALKNINPSGVDATHNHALMATPISQLAKKKDGPQHFQAVAPEDRQKLALRGQEVQKSRERRHTLEAAGANPAIHKPGAVTEPSTLQLPKSSIVGKPAKQFKKGEMPPEVPQTPKAEIKAPPKSGTPLPDGASRDKPVLPPTGKPEIVPGKTAVLPETPKPEVVPGKKPVRPDGPKPEIAPGKKPVLPETPKPEVVPGKKPVRPDGPKPEIVPDKKPVLPATRKPEVVPAPRPVQPPPRKPEVVPAPRPVQPPPRVPEVAPAPKPVQPPPRVPEVVPAPKPVQPAPRGPDAEKADKKDHKNDPK